MARSILRPDTQESNDFFICDLSNVIPKSDIASMENPLFTLSTKPDKELKKYTSNGYTVEIAPSFYGHATIHDKDILIYCISKLMKGVNVAIDEALIHDKDSKTYTPPSRKVRFKAHDLLVTTRRSTSGRGYDLLKKALERLNGTVIKTNIKTAETEITRGFGLIDSYEVVHENPKTKRMVEVELTLSEWLYNAVTHQEVLSISKEYIFIRRPVDKRLYEIARKFCGNKKQWSISLEKLYDKVGTSGTIFKFKEALLYTIDCLYSGKEDYIFPDYDISIDRNIVTFYYRKYKEKSKYIDYNKPTLQADTYDKARKILGREFDVYAIEQDWFNHWVSKGKEELKNPDGAFINFCKSRMKILNNNN